MRDDGFERAVIMHQKRVHAYASLMLKDVSEAQDVSQEALVRLWQNQGRVEEQGAKFWLMRTVHNLCIDRIRRRKVRAEVADGETALDRAHDASAGPQELAESGELGGAIARALSGLSPEDRSVVILREVQGLPYDEIAETLAVPLGTIKARLHRARERLRTRLTRAGVTP